MGLATFEDKYNWWPWLVYFEGDDIDEIDFLKESSCSFVLPRYNNIKYMNIYKGQQFSVIDIIACTMEHDDFYNTELLALIDIHVFDIVIPG